MLVLEALMPEVQKISEEIKRTISGPVVTVALKRGEIVLSLLSSHAGWYIDLGYISHSGATVSYSNESGLTTTYEISDPNFMSDLLVAMRADFHSSSLRQPSYPYPPGQAW